MSRKPAGLRELKKGAIDRAASAIVSYMERRGFDEVKITSKYLRQKRDIMIYVRPDPEVPAVCIAELNYDYPSAAVRDEIRYKVNALVMEKLKGKSQAQ